MGRKQDKRQEPGESREQQERLRSGQDAAHPGTGPESARGKSPEELQRRGRDEMNRDADEIRDDEL